MSGAGREGPCDATAGVFAAGFVGLGLLVVPSIVALTAAVALVVLGMFLVHPLNSAEAGRRVPGHRAQATALYQISWLAGATVLGPVSTSVYQAAGWTATVVFLVVVLAIGLVASVFDRPPTLPER